MADPYGPAGVRKHRRWLAGRAGRREYWLYVGLLILLGLVLRYAAPIFNLGFTVVLAFVQTRRLHDYGRSGWWAAAAALAPILPALPTFYLAGEDLAALVGAAVELILVILIGAWPGDAGENRFGPPPPFTVSRVLMGR